MDVKDFLDSRFPVGVIATGPVNIAGSHCSTIPLLSQKEKIRRLTILQ